MNELEKLIAVLDRIDEKLDKILDRQEEAAAQVAINSYMTLAASMMQPVEREDGSTGHGLDETALEKAYENLQDNFYALQEKLETEEQQ